MLLMMHYRVCAMKTVQMEAVEAHGESDREGKGDERGDRGRWYV